MTPCRYQEPVPLHEWDFFVSPPDGIHRERVRELVAAIERVRMHDRMKWERLMDELDEMHDFYRCAPL